MKCRNCGAFNEDYMEYCENCASPLIPEESAPVFEEDTAPAPAAAPAPEPGAPSMGEGGPQTSWGFVQSPRWIQPEFDANTISEEDIPATFQPQLSYGAFAAPDAARTQAQDAPFAPQQDVYAAPAYAQPQQGYSPAPMQDAAPQSPYADGYGAESRQSAYSAAPYGAQPYGAPSYGQEQGYAYPASSAPYAAAPAFGAQPYGAAAPAEAQPFRGGMKYGEGADDGYFGPEPSGRDARKRSGAKKPRKAKAAPAGKRDIKSLLFWIAAGVLVVLIIVFSIIFFTKRAGDDEPSSPGESAAQNEEREPNSSSNKPAFLGGIFSKNPITKPAVIEEGLTTSGDPAYIITIYAKNNSTVRFTAGELVKENPVEDGSLKLRAPRELWIPEGPVEEASIEVYPDIVVISKDGEEYPVEFDAPIVIDLPTIELSLSDPTTATVTTADGNVSVAGIVGDTTAEVFVNDTQLYLDESGNFAGTYTVPGYGTHEVRVEARKSGCQIARQSFSVEYPDPAGASAPAVIEGMGGGTATPATPAGAVPSNASSVAYVTTDDLNVRDQAAQSGNILGKLPLCTKVYIVMEDAGNGWAKILYNNAEAYASKQYLNIVATAADYRTTTATVKTDDLNLRSASSTSGESLAKLANGTTLNYIKDAGSDWSMVEYNGLIGFVATQYISR